MQSVFVQASCEIRFLRALVFRSPSLSLALLLLAPWPLLCGSSLCPSLLLAFAVCGRGGAAPKHNVGNQPLNATTMP